MCVEGGKDSALPGSGHFCGRPRFPGERPTIANGTTDATDTVEQFCIIHAAHVTHTTDILGLVRPGTCTQVHVIPLRLLSLQGN